MPRIGSGFVQGAAWVGGLAALVVVAWFAVGLGLLPALLAGLVAGLGVRFGWRRLQGAGASSEGDPETWESTGGRKVEDSEPATPPTSPGAGIPAPEPTGRTEAAASGLSSPRAARPRLLWALLGVAGLGAGALLLVIAGPVVDWTVQPSPPAPGIGSIYRASVEPGPQRETLIVRERYAVSVADIQASPDLDSPEAFRPAEGRFHVPEGWEGALVRDSLILTRERTERLEVSLLRPTSVAAVRIPAVHYDGPVLWARPGSRVEIDLPRYFLVESFPPSEPAVDLLDPRGLERSVVPLTIGAGDPREVRLRVLHAALRNPVGVGLTQASLLAPVKWAALAFVAIFAEQIKVRMLLPLARRISETLKLPLFEGGRAT